MTPTEAINILYHAAGERITDARAAGQPLTADLLVMNVEAARKVLAPLVAPKTEATAS